MLRNVSTSSPWSMLMPTRRSRSSMLEHHLQVEDAYWNLVSAWRNVAIQEEALKDAVTQQKSTVRLGEARSRGADRCDGIRDASRDLPR